MFPNAVTAFKGYLILLAALAVAILLSFVVYPFLSPGPILIFVAGLVVAAWYGGRLPALIYSLLATLATDLLFGTTLFRIDESWYTLTIRFTFLCVIAILISSLRKAKERLEVRARQQAAVAEFGRLALTRTSLHPLLERAAEILTEELGVQYAAVCKVLHGSREVEFVAVSGWDEKVKGRRFSYDEDCSLAGEVVASDLPVIVTDLRKRGNYQASDGLVAAGVRSGVGMRIAPREGIYGILGAFGRAPRHFTNDDVNFLQSIANIIAEAVDRFRSEEAVREQKRWLQTTLTSIGDGVIATDASGRVMFLNPVAERLTGWVEEDARGKKFSEVFRVVEKASGAGIADPVSRVLETGTAVALSSHTLLLGKDGREIPIDNSAAPITDDGEVKGVVLVFSDVSERKLSEAKLLENEERLRLATQTGRVGVWDWDIRRNKVEWTDALYEMHGLKKGEFGGTVEAFAGLVHPEDRSRVKAALDHSLETGERYDVEFRTVRPDGEQRWLSTNAQVMRDEHGPCRMVGATADITERVRADADRRENEIMQRLVEAQESERQRIARDLHDHLGQKMTGLRFKIESALSKSDENPELQVLLDEIQESALQIDQDIGFLSWELRPTELDNLGLDNALASFVREWSSQYAINAEFHSNLADIREQNGRLSRTIETNLYRIAQEGLNNAMKHANAKNVSVLLQYRKDRLVLIIEDDGDGIPEDYNISFGRMKGSFGLIGMHERAALLKGSFEIESRPGEGTALIVTVPLYRVFAGATAA